MPVVNMISVRIMVHHIKKLTFVPYRFRSCWNPKIKGAIVFHDQGPQSFDYSIRLNHSWAFSGFPDVKSIMDTNGPYLNDLELGVNTLPIMQYSFSGFLTVCTLFFIIVLCVHSRSVLLLMDQVD